MPRYYYRPMQGTKVKRFNLWPLRIAIKFGKGYMIIGIGRSKLNENHNHNYSSDWVDHCFGNIFNHGAMFFKQGG